jgi:hypothetical protein
VLNVWVASLVENPLDAKGQGIIGQAGNFVNDIVDNIKSIFTTTEEKAVRRPTGSSTRAQTPVAPDTTVSPPNIISPSVTSAVNSEGSTINIGGKDVSVGYGAGQVDPGIAVAVNRMQKNKEDKVDPALDAPNPRAASVDAAAERAADKKKKKDKEDRDKGKARSAEKALETSRAGTSEVLSNISSRGKAEGKSDTAIINEAAAANKEARKVESALKDISKGVKRGFNQGGLASRKQITNNNPINKDRGVAARKKK